MNLVKIERQKKSLQSYLIAAVIIPLVCLMLLYLVAFVSKQPMPSSAPSGQDMNSYSFLYQISFISNVAGYVMLGATMLVKYVLEAYSDRNLYLTLGYPVSRTKVFFSKLFLCLSVTSIGVFVSIFVTNTLFFISESLFQLVEDKLTFQSVLNQLPIMLTAAVLVSSICLIALFIGWLKNSVPLVLISAILLFSIPSNLASSGNMSVIAVLTVILFIFGLIVVGVLKNKVLRLEA
ncbi:hypothetical protein [Enterococcus sp. AZ163]|uniref:hypothetical protein n=1 Tax=Enterococcus sp. AZ163 TaxID=2774638 RepID=UPI003D2B17EE